MCAIKDIESEDFPISKGDILGIYGTANDFSLPAENLFKKVRGFVNANDITDKLEESFTLSSWKPIDRDESIALLAKPGVEPGTFILHQTSGWSIISYGIFMN